MTSLMSERLAPVLELGLKLAKSSENRGGVCVVDRGQFREFRARSLSIIRDTFGPEHPHYKEFDQNVTSAAKSHVEMGVGILRAAEADLEHGKPRRVGIGALPFEDLLHPAVAEHALPHFRNGHFRDAVLNSIIAVFDLLRAKTGLQTDGTTLATEALSLQRPRLLVADIATESGRNEQLGTMKLLEGAYSAIRNPKAHTLAHDTTPEVAAQYMVFASLLARRIDEGSAPAT